MLIFETKNYVVEAPGQPLVDRGDGGHIIIEPKEKVRDRQALSALLAIELVRLIAVTGEAMTTMMNQHGVDIGRINYQENGNWSVFKPEGAFLHVHIYGRAKSAKIQVYGQALYFPHRDQHPEFYADLNPLTERDVLAIREEMKRLLLLSRYSDSEWRL